MKQCRALYMCVCSELTLVCFQKGQVCAATIISVFLQHRSFANIAAAHHFASILVTNVLASSSIFKGFEAFILFPRGV